MPQIHQLTIHILARAGEANLSKLFSSENRFILRGNDFLLTGLIPAGT